MLGLDGNFDLGNEGFNDPNQVGVIMERSPDEDVQRRNQL